MNQPTSGDLFVWLCSSQREKERTNDMIVVVLASFWPKRERANDMMVAVLASFWPKMIMIIHVLRRRVGF